RAVPAALHTHRQTLDGPLKTISKAAAEGTKAHNVCAFCASLWLLHFSLAIIPYTPTYPFGTLLRKRTNACITMSVKHPEVRPSDDHVRRDEFTNLQSSELAP